VRLTVRGFLIDITKMARFDGNMFWRNENRNISKFITYEYRVTLAVIAAALPGKNSNYATN
jgi:hypothetical protein